jgi:DNA helicase-2/ATP-dependent DNA helicase PcrA
VVAIERNIGGVTLYHVPLKGKIDKLEFNGNEVTVVDYKSGNVEKALQKTIPPSAEMPNGGDYWRQAIFYKILIDQYQQKDWRVKNVCFDFIEPNANGNFQKTSILLDECSITTVQQQIVHVWERIQAHDFFTGCGKRNCYWCSITSTQANK